MKNAKKQAMVASLLSDIYTFDYDLPLTAKEMWYLSITTFQYRLQFSIEDHITSAITLGGGTFQTFYVFNGSPFSRRVEPHVFVFCSLSVFLLL